MGITFKCKKGEKECQSDISYSGWSFILESLTRATCKYIESLPIENPNTDFIPDYENLIKELKEYSKKPKNDKCFLRAMHAFQLDGIYKLDDSYEIYEMYFSSGAAMSLIILLDKLKPIYEHWQNEKDCDEPYWIYHWLFLDNESFYKLCEFSVTHRSPIVMV